MRKLRLMKYFRCTHDENYEDFIERMNKWIVTSDVYVVNVDRVNMSVFILFYENR